MQRLTLALPGNEDFAGRLAQAYGSDVGRVETRRFPDGESYVRLHGEPVGQIVDLICTLTHPDPQFLLLVFGLYAVSCGTRRPYPTGATALNG